MAIKEPIFTLGIEEEYLLVDKQTLDTVKDPPASMMERCEARLKGQVSHEFLRCQIEVGTRVAGTLGEARADLAHLRNVVAEEADREGLALLAAATHPFADWVDEITTPRDRYEGLARDMGVAIQRLLICGMHVHVCIEDPDLRIDLMNQVRYFLPHLLALSTSSPFWQGRDTGLKSYRLAVFGDLPRSGMPDTFDRFSEYEANVQALVDTGVIEDATKLWWDIRPSVRYPTLEVRICDICTRLDDAVTIAALYLCLLRMLFRLRRTNIGWRRYRTMLIEENRWRAQRYGMEEGLIDFGRGEMVPYAELLEEILEMTQEDGEALGCLTELNRAREIVARGTSADRQRAILHDARVEGLDEMAALKRVTQWLVDETVADL